MVVTLETALEPLATATGETYKQLKLTDVDYLFVQQTKSGSTFIIRLMGLRPRTEHDAGERRVVNGQDMTWIGFLGPHVFSFHKRFPEIKKSKKHKHQYEVPATDISAMVILASWPIDRIIDVDGTSLDHIKYLVGRYMLHTNRSRYIAEFKEFGIVPEPPDDWFDHPELPMSKSQRFVVQLTLGETGFAMFADMGTGKTAMSVRRLCMEATRTRAGMPGYGLPRMMRAIIVVPQQVRSNWQREIARFSTVPCKTVIAKGGALDRVNQMVHAVREDPNCEFGAVIISFDTLVASIDVFERVQWDLIIVDESHKFKGERSQRWKAMKRLRESSDRRMILTGTPIGNHVSDCYTQLEFLEDGLSGFRAFKAMNRFYAKAEIKDETGISRFVGTSNMPMLRERIARSGITLTKDEAGLKLPPKIYDIAEVEMSTQQARYYKTISEDLALEIEDKMSGDVTAMTANHVLTMLLRLAQITSGHVTWDAVYDDDTGDVLREKKVQQVSVENPKIQWLVDELTGRPDPLSKCCIWAIFVEDIMEIYRRLGEAGIGVVKYHGAMNQDERDAAVDAFNMDPQTTVIICNPQCAAEGLDLLGYDKTDAENSHTYADHQVIFSQGWSAILRTQLEDRLVRRGTRKSVRITDLIVPDTIDNEIRTYVTEKRSVAASVLDVREILRSVLKLG